MKRIFLILCLFLFSCGSEAKEKDDVAPIFTGGFVTHHGHLRTMLSRVINEKGESVTLRGMSLFWSNWGGKYYTDGVVKTLAQDWGVSVIRLAMGIENDNGYLQNPEYHKALIKNMIRAAIAEDIYVIIDWHDHNAHIRRDKALEFFDEISREFGQYPNLIYELYNEPLWIDWSIIKNYAEPIIDKIRENGSQNLIVVGTPAWSQNVDSAISNPIEKENILYALHFYSATHKQWLRDKGNRALGAGLPLMITEFGLSEASGDGRLDYEETERWLSWAEENGISWLNWSVFDKRESSAALKPGANPSGNWSSWDLTSSGSWIKRKLLSFKMPVVQEL